MSTIQPISNINVKTNKPLITTSNTGYTALGGMALATASAIIPNKTIKGYHKPLAYLSGLLTLFHLGTALHTKSQFKKEHLL